MVKRYRCTDAGSPYESYGEPIMEEYSEGPFVKFSDIEPLIEAVKFYAAKCPNEPGTAPQFIEVYDGELSENFGREARQALKSIGEV